MFKRGMLLASEVLKMVVAVICIGLLIYLLVYLYFSSQANKERAHAQASIEKIERVIESMDAQAEVDSITPEGWFLFSFVGASSKPRACAGKNCLCVCKRVSYGQDDECDEKGACLIVPGLDGFSPIELKIDNRIEFERDEGGIIKVREK